MVQPLHVGNALRLHMRPPAASLRWRVLRRADPGFTGPQATDEQVAVYEGSEPVFLDTAFLMNDVMVFYRAYYFTSADETVYTESNVAHGTPAASYREQSDDVLTFLRERLEVGLKVEVERGVLAHENGYIPVYNAAPALEETIRFPVVTVHLESDDPTERGIGEVITNDVFDSIGDVWGESEGWISATRVTVIGWSQNSDERIELRKALRRLIVANLQVFASKGWQQIEFGSQDIDSINGEFPVPFFQVMGNFTCLAPVVVGGDVEPIHEVEVTANTF